MNLNQQPPEPTQGIEQPTTLSFTAQLERVQNIVGEIKRLIEERDKLIDWEYDKRGKEKVTKTDDPAVLEANQMIINLQHELDVIVPNKKEFAEKLYGINEVLTANLFKKYSKGYLDEISSHQVKKKTFLEGLFG